MPTMYVMRGLPGSGKSYKARQLQSELAGSVVYSTDDFFMVNGEYKFDPKRLAANHAANQKRARQACETGVDVIIDNTGLKAWECREYVRMALDHGYKVVLVEPETSWAKDPVECAKRNSHGVPLETIERMLASWEIFTAQDCLTVKAPWEP